MTFKDNYIAFREQMLMVFIVVFFTLQCSIWAMAVWKFYHYSNALKHQQKNIELHGEMILELYYEVDSIRRHPDVF